MSDYVTVMAKNGDTYVPILLDPADAEALGSRRLSLGSHGYAQVCVPGDGVSSLLHRVLLGLIKGDGLIGDHRNGNPLDYRRENLRIVDPSGSSQNVSGRGKSKYRGVHPMKSGRWATRVKFQRKTHYLGTFATEEEAAKAADAKRRELMPYYVPPEERS